MKEIRDFVRSRWRVQLVSFVFGCALVAILYSLPLSPHFKKLLLDYPSETFPWTVQTIMWIVSVICFGELLHRLGAAIDCASGLQAKILSEDEQAIYQVSDMGAIYKKVSRFAEYPNDLASMLRLLVLQFQSSKSVAQTHAMLNSIIELESAQIDVSYQITRYLTWLIPTLGFVGTVLGISMALEFAGSPTTDPNSSEFLKLVTSKLGVAFYTTLLALCQSAVLILFMHLIQAYEEKVLLLKGRYCLENFINRIFAD